MKYIMDYMDQIMLWELNAIADIYNFLHYSLITFLLNNMETVDNFLNLPINKFALSNPYKIMAGILVIGLIWIYFQIPNIKAKTAPPNGIVSSRDEWIEARSNANKYSLLWSFFCIASVYARWQYTSVQGFDFIALFLNSMIVICLLMVTATQFMNRKITTNYINN